MNLPRKKTLQRTPFALSLPKPAKGVTKKKLCAVCKTPYEPRTPMAKVCSIPCAITHSAAVTAKQKAKKERQERAQDKVKRESMKTRPQLVREAQSEVNKYVRLRDDGLPCISCGVNYPEDRNDVWDAGHLRSAGSSPGTRFNTLNIHKQCVRCNQYLSSNALKYRIALIEKIGLDMVEKIESHPGISKFSHDYLIRLKFIFRKRIKHLRNLRERIGNEKIQI